MNHRGLHSAASLLTLVALATISVWLSAAPRDRLTGRAAAAYTRGIAFLAASQRENGEFPTYYWPMDAPTKIAPVTTVFTASQILYSLAFRSPAGLGGLVTERTMAYLLAQRESPGVWRYYGRSGAHLLSPDVDDTAVAWAALALHGHAIPTDALALVEGSRNGSGLFNTWIGDPATWVGVDSRDTDLVVNLNALLLFSLAGRTVDEVCRAAVATAKAGASARHSVYYPSPLAFTYALSRAYADGGAICLREAIPSARLAALAAQQPDGGWGSDLDTALGLLTLLNGGYRGEAVRQGIDVLLTRQAADGGWALAAAYRAAVLPISYGSRSLTTAVCLEALAKYLGR